MGIKSLKLVNFRSYDECMLEFCNNINYIYGNNALGKTNIVEAIYFACITKSFRADNFSQCIKFNKNYARILCAFDESTIEVDMQIDDLNKATGKKIIKDNGNVIQKFADYIGKNPVVLFSPDDMNLTKSAPKVRRRFLDVLISQINKSYIYALSEYNKLLQNKNTLLKQENVDINYLEILNEKLSICTFEICKKRQEIVQILNKESKSFQQSISNNTENIEITYKTDFEFSSSLAILKQLNSNIQKDIFKKVSTLNINHDDLEIYINGLMVSIYGSQGQNRTAILSMKLAELEILKQYKNRTPIILLDDVFSELDSQRIEYLLKYIEEYQVIITTTSKIDNITLNSTNCSIFNVSSLGVVKKEIK